MKIVVVIFMLGAVASVFCQTIRFPDEELAQETVLPVFENNKNVVMNRTVQLKYKLNLSQSILFRGDEPFYNPLAFSLNMGFAFNETHSMKLIGLYFQPGISTQGQALKRGVPIAYKEAPGLSPSGKDLVQRSKKKTTVEILKFDAGTAPHPKAALFAGYEIIPFYGKLSFTKTIAAHFHISLLFGGGAVALTPVGGDVGLSALELLRWQPAGCVQLNQKIFFTRRFYIHGEINMFGYYGPNPVNKKLFNLSRQQITIGFEEFESTFFVRNFVGGGLGFLLF